MGVRFVVGTASAHLDWLWAHPSPYAMSTGSSTWRLKCVERGAIQHFLTCLHGMRFKREVAVVPIIYLNPQPWTHIYKEKHEISGMNSSTSYSEAKQVGTRMCYQHVGGNLWRSSSWIRETAAQSIRHVGEDVDWSHTVQIDTSLFFSPRSLIANISSHYNFV
jgi:hypothetical protein